MRMMSAAPWRLDALEILQVARMARYDRRHLIEVVHEVVESGELEVDRTAEVEATARTATPTATAMPTATGAAEPATSRRHGGRRPAPRTRRHVDPSRAPSCAACCGTLEDLAARTWREGPFTVLEEYVARTGLVLDLLAIDSLEAKRTIANIGSFMRFAQDWQAEHPRGCLGGLRGLPRRLPGAPAGSCRPAWRPARTSWASSS